MQQQLRGKKQQLVFAKHHILLNALLGGVSYSSTTEAIGRKTCNLYEQSCCHCCCMAIIILNNPDL